MFQMRIPKVDRVGIGVYPTPYERMPRLEAELNGPRLFVKREDLTGVALGEDKVRQLNYILVEAH
jgi:L-cysteate sulfo-lyase